MKKTSDDDEGDNSSKKTLFLWHNTAIDVGWKQEYRCVARWEEIPKKNNG